MANRWRACPALPWLVYGINGASLIPRTAHSVPLLACQQCDAEHGSVLYQWADLSSARRACGGSTDGGSSTALLASQQCHQVPPVARAGFGLESDIRPRH